jgi:hypothetical protein
VVLKKLLSSFGKNWYAVIVDGENIYTKDAGSGEVVLLGCVTTRVVCADSSEEAGALAVKMVTDELIGITVNAVNDPPKCSVDTMYRPSWSQIFQAPLKGSTFFREERTQH